MSAARARPRWVRIGLAATRLAALYAAGVTTLVVATFVVLRIVDGGSRLPRVAEVFYLNAIPFSFAFLSSFVVLAVARRAGFVLLWSLLLALWGYLLFVAQHSSRGVENAVVGMFAWSVLALPLFALVVLGVPECGGAPRRRWWAPGPGPLLAAWIVSIAAGIATAMTPAYVGGQPAVLHSILNAVYLVWVPVPFLVGAWSIARVWPSRMSARLAPPEREKIEAS